MYLPSDVSEVRALWDNYDAWQLERGFIKRELEGIWVMVYGTAPRSSYRKSDLIRGINQYFRSINRAQALKP